jgi:hypothetical protein
MTYTFPYFMRSRERPGPEWDTDRELSKHFLELMKRLGDIRHQFQLD